MRILNRIFLASTMTLAATGLAASKKDQSAKVRLEAIGIAEGTYKKIFDDPKFKDAILSEIKKSNEQYPKSYKRVSEEPDAKLKQKDKKWRKWVKKSILAAKKGKNPPKAEAFIAAVTGNQASILLKQLAGSSENISEVFIMDRVGANVAVAEPTSDFDQGDESKWSKPFKENVSPHAGDSTRDASSNSYQTQVSILIQDGGESIGVMTIGVSNK